jgi:2-polyprenyl-3-methyl-5-hydroxy-6-metoxy-1,4-benzoquinol methylase
MPHRYHTEIDPESDTSHAIVLRLVGSAPRVLDVGCATGAVAAALKDRGCRVAGVEVDKAAAEKARPHLDDLLVGSVQELDLLAHFGEGAFDAIILADVLEHLEDPTAILRQMRPLLADDGFVVASIPNVAHGSVRLALLQGRFEYTEVGLLDRTHLRFFTSTTVDNLFADAGFVPVEVERTTVDFFETEIKLSPSDFDRTVLDALEADPEATTYQFVVKARPDGGDLRIRELQLREHQLQQLIHELEHELRTVERRLSAPRDWPEGARHVGVWGHFDTADPSDRLRGYVHRHELAQRLSGWHVRAFAPFGWTRPDTDHSTGPIEPLRETNDDRASMLAAELDAVVMVGELTARGDVLAARYGGNAVGGDHPAMLLAAPPPWRERGPLLVHSGILATVDPTRDDDRRLLQWMADGSMFSTVADEVALAVRTIGRSVELVPDPLLLLPRVFEPGHLGAVRAGMAVRGLVPDRSYVVVHGSGEVESRVGAIVGAVERLRQEEPGLAVVAANLDGRLGEGGFSGSVMRSMTDALPVAGLSAEEAVALVAGAAIVVSSSPWVGTVAGAYGVPAMVSAGIGLAALADRAVLVTLHRTKVAGVTSVQATLDEYFDRLAATIAHAPFRAVREPMPAGLADLIGALEAFAAATDEQRLHERTAFAERLATLAALRSEVEAARVAAEAAREGLAATRSELQALQSTKAWRLATMLRRPYGRLRRLAGQ